MQQHAPQTHPARRVRAQLFLWTSFPILFPLAQPSPPQRARKIGIAIAGRAVEDVLAWSERTQWGTATAPAGAWVRGLLQFWGSLRSVKVDWHRHVDGLEAVVEAEGCRVYFGEHGVVESGRFFVYQFQEPGEEPGNRDQGYSAWRKWWACGIAGHVFAENPFRPVWIKLG